MGAVAKVLILLAVAVVGGAAFLLYGASDKAESAVEDRVRMVRVAAQPLMVGTFLDDAKAPLVAMPESAIGADFVTAAGPDMAGAVIIAPVAEGQPVRRGALLAPGQDGFLAAVLQPGFRAVSLAVDAVSGNAGHIFPGDRVDVLLTQQVEVAALGGADPGRRWASETILRNVRVIAVDQKLGGDLAQRGIEGAPGAGVARTITVEVTPDGAETLAVARNLGTLSLTLRSLIVEAADGAHPDAVLDAAPQQPTWARDVSAVTRAATGVPVAPEPIAEVQALPQPVRVLRGGRAERISQ